MASRLVDCDSKVRILTFSSTGFLYQFWLAGVCWQTRWCTHRELWRQLSDILQVLGGWTDRITMSGRFDVQPENKELRLARQCSVRSVGRARTWANEHHWGHGYNHLLRWTTINHTTLGGYMRWWASRWVFACENLRALEFYLSIPLGSDLSKFDEFFRRINSKIPSSEIPNVKRERMERKIGKIRFQGPVEHFHEFSGPRTLLYNFPRFPLSLDPSQKPL